MSATGGALLFLVAVAAGDGGVPLVRPWGDNTLRIQVGACDGRTHNPNPPPTFPSHSSKRTFTTRHPASE